MQFALSPYSKRLVSCVHLAASATTADLLLRSTILSQPGNSAEAVGRHDHREFARKAARSASSSFASVAMSSALVASSRINRDGRWERARARPMRWRCRPGAGYRTLQLFVLKPSAGIKTSSGGKCPDSRRFVIECRHEHR